MKKNDMHLLQFCLKNETRNKTKLILEHLENKYKIKKIYRNNNRSLYTNANKDLSCFCSMPNNNKSLETLKDYTILFDGWVSLPNDLQNVLNKYSLQRKKSMINEEAINIKDKIEFFESLGIKTEEKELVHSKPLVVDERLRDLDYVLSIEKYKNKFVEEQKLRNKLDCQIKRLLKNNQQDSCLIPSEILTKADEIYDEEEPEYNR